MTDIQCAECELSLPPAPARVHFIGIGGVSMSGLARVLKGRGYIVTGSDASESATVLALRAEGIEIAHGHTDPALAAMADVVVSTPRAAANAAGELAAARRNNSQVVRRGQLLGMIANPLRCIAVAGTHGKSTTSGMLAMALIGMGLDPGYAVGASLPGMTENTVSGSGEFMVVEADEFDRAFHWLRPEVAVVTSVSFDHPDIYADQADYDAAFVTFAGHTRPAGTLVIAADDPGCQRVLSALQSKPDSPRIVTFGETPEADSQLISRDDGWTFRGPDAVTYDADLSVPGRHNARNALAAVTALAAVGLDPRASLDALKPFTGVGRRFEHKGVIGGIDVIDDYAHHPEEIAAVLAAARMRYPGRRIIAVHQPHTYSRTKSLLNEFASSLDLADRVVLLDIYPSGENDTLGISSRDVLDRISVPASSATGPEDAAARTAAMAREGDVIMTMGAGDITRTGAHLLELLSTPPTAAPPRPAPARTARRVTAPAVTLPGAPHLKVVRDAAMSLYTTMRVGGPADYFVRAPTPEDVIAVARWAREQDLPVTLIGGGSNLLVGDRGIRGVVIAARTTGERATDLISAEDRGDHVRVTVGAQAPLSWVGRYCAEHGWAGMDWGVGLPGQIGGATANNAGAHGTELKDHLVEIELLLDSGEIERRPAGWLDATYRMTRIKVSPRPRPWIVLRSVFDLPKDDPAKLVALADDHADFRKSTQPTGPCSGSTFANPEGDFAGRLLEAAGLKGYRMGAMQLSPKHANWVLNTGGGTAAEAWELIEYARRTVRETFGVTLRPEIERVGEP